MGSSLDSASDTHLSGSDIATRSMFEFQLHESGIHGEAAARVMEGKSLRRSNPSIELQCFMRMRMQQMGVPPEQIDEMIERAI